MRNQSTMLSLYVLEEWELTIIVCSFIAERGLSHSLFIDWIPIAAVSIRFAGCVMPWFIPSFCCRSERIMWSQPELLLIALCFMWERALFEFACRSHSIKITVYTVSLYLFYCRSVFFLLSFILCGRWSFERNSGLESHFCFLYSQMTITHSILVYCSVLLISVVI